MRKPKLANLRSELFGNFLKDYELKENRRHFI